MGVDVEDGNSTLMVTVPRALSNPSNAAYVNDVTPKNPPEVYTKEPSLCRTTVPSEGDIADTKEETNVAPSGSSSFNRTPRGGTLSTGSPPSKEYVSFITLGRRFAVKATSLPGTAMSSNKYVTNITTGPTVRAAPSGALVNCAFKAE